jgi:hypothetical protein
LVTFEKLYEDMRGAIFLIKHQDKEFILWTLKKGHIRGGDYHKSTQYDVILSGKVLVTSHINGKDVKRLCGENTIISFKPEEPHMIQALTDDVLVLEWLEGEFEKQYYEPYRRLIRKKMGVSN